jgi:CDP-diacylglycerol--glycerol-3-phosphate 3-phosphatidyltransferase
MNLPNTITLGRIFLVPLLVVVLLTNPKELNLFGVGQELLGALIFAIASLTDWLDGYLARRRKQVTGFGQWMDPLADKLLVTAALISLVSMGRASAWMVAVILGREYAVTVLRSIAHAKGYALPASPLGKVKLITQVIAILLLILWGAPGHWANQLGHLALWVATVAALVSAVDYSRRFNASLNGAPAPAAKVTEWRAPALEGPTAAGLKTRSTQTRT